MTVPIDESALSPSFWGRRFDSPLMLASGTAGFGLELARMGYLGGVGAVVSKATTLEPRKGNSPPRIAETRFGLLNAIGLANPGVDAIVDEVLPQLTDLPCPLVVNVAGKAEADFVEVVRRLEDSPIPLGYEINVSCPNVSEGGIAFGSCPDTVERISAGVAGITDRPFSVKLTPNSGDIIESARAAENGGASAVTVCNTFLGMHIDWATGSTAIATGTGGYTSPALLPLVVARVYRVGKAVDIPVIASGGVSRGEDVLELLAAGAAMVQVGTMLLRRPSIAAELVEQLETLLR